MYSKIKFKWSDLWVTSHEQTSDFYLSAWQRGASPWPLLAARAVLAAAALGILVWSLAGSSGASPYWLIYLTNWGLVLVTAMALAALLVSCTAAYRRPTEGDPAPWGVPLYWVLFNVAQSVALAITVLYWLLLYDPEETVYVSTGALWRDVATHALNSALTAAELLAARTPVRLAHAYQPLLLAAIYVAFSGIYFAADGVDMFGSPYIYSVLDWAAPDTAGAVAGAALAGVAVLHAAVWALARARAAAGRALRRRRRSGGAAKDNPGAP